MRILDWIGFLFIAAGLSGVWIGHHILGLMWYWSGVAILIVGCAIIFTSARQKRLEKAMRDYRGPGDGGNTDYHSGASASFGSDGGGDGGGD